MWRGVGRSPFFAKTFRGVLTLLPELLMSSRTVAVPEAVCGRPLEDNQIAGSQLEPLF